MENIHALETHVLMDLLVKRTAELTARIAARDVRATDQYEYDLAMIQAELNSRQQSKDNTTISDKGIEFTSASVPVPESIDSVNISTTE